VSKAEEVRAARVQHIYAKRRRFSRTEAAVALGKSVAWVEKNRFSPENGPLLEWEEVVLLTQLLWTTVQIYTSLGPLVDTVLPNLRRLVVVPILMTEQRRIALNYLARKERQDIHELVMDRITVYRDEAQIINERVPGYLDSWHFPYRKESWDDA